MGSQAKQAALWGQRPEDWATIQEPTGNAGYEFALSKLNLTNKNNLLDIGCGSGLFCSMVNETGATAIGLDATGELLNEARKRLPQMIFVTV
jgi:cyclopropane fatty-acyl-phospholipid synthase-like methyltransferase